MRVWKRNLLLLSTVVAIGSVGANTTVWGEASDHQTDTAQESNAPSEEAAVEQKEPIIEEKEPTAEEPAANDEETKAEEAQSEGLQTSTEQKLSQPTESSSIQSYGEMLKNGDFSLFASDNGTADGWLLEQDAQGSALAVANEKLETGKQQLIVLALKESQQIRFVQEVKVVGKQKYSWKAWHTLMGNGADVYWEAVFMNADKQVIGREKLQDAGMNAKPQNGETPAGTASVRIQLVAAGERSSSAVIEAKKASFVILKKDLTPAPQPSEPVTYTYTYDANGRLTLVDTAKGKMQYSYDANGNMLKKAAEGVIKPPDPQPEEPEVPIEQPEVLPDLGEIVSGSTYDLYSVDETIPMNGVKIVFKGWYLSQKEVDKVEYYWNDSTLLGESAYGLKDETVYFNHPEYGNHHAGFKLAVDMGSKFESLSTGSYKISVVIKHKDGSSHTLEQTIQIRRIAP